MAPRRPDLTPEIRQQIVNAYGDGQGVSASQLQKQFKLTPGTFYRIVNAGNPQPQPQPGTEPRVTPRPTPQTPAPSQPKGIPGQIGHFASDLAARYMCVIEMNGPDVPTIVSQLERKLGDKVTIMSVVRPDLIEA